MTIPRSFSVDSFCIPDFTPLRGLRRKLYSGKSVFVIYNFFSACVPPSLKEFMYNFIERFILLKWFELSFEALRYLTESSEIIFCGWREHVACRSS
ncbi:hypothetical protein BEQ56_05520 [Anaerolineaceae bacterium oral taxon 439]|nr:hypothetical protein BEQ56_05520 [Anaerolineaceae bacterium oral taxon 439]